MLARFEAEVGDDRTALLPIMAEVDVPLRRYKVNAAWATEKVGRPAHGYFRGRPLSIAVELEVLRLGVERRHISVGCRRGPATKPTFSRSYAHTRLQKSSAGFRVPDD